MRLGEIEMDRGFGETQPRHPVRLRPIDLQAHAQPLIPPRRPLARRVLDHERQRRCLRLGEERVCVSEPVELRSLPIDRLYPLPELVARRIRIDGVRALALEENSALLLLDLRALLAQRIASR